MEACASWMDTHEDFPPGLRDLELDEVLTTPARLTGPLEAPVAHRKRCVPSVPVPCWLSA